jgi:hypothetical protein
MSNDHYDRKTVTFNLTVNHAPIVLFDSSGYGNFTGSHQKGLQKIQEDIV